MSQEARDALANRLALTDDTQRTDICDEPYKTNTYLIDFLTQLSDTCGHQILVTALNSDHDPGTWHNPPGQAVDCWHADWETVGDDEIVDLLDAAAAIAQQGGLTLLEVGLSGDAVTAADEMDFSFPENTEVFVEDYGQDNEHVHFAVGPP